MGIALAVIGSACILYGASVMLVGSGTWFFTFWFFLGAALLAASWFVCTGRWDALPGMARAVIACVVVALIIGFGATQVLIMQDFGDEGEPGLDYIIVLGAQVHERGPSVVLKYRLDAAYDYLVANPHTQCIVSGGQGPNEHTAEANVMADYLEERGIDPTRIIREPDSESTEQNIAFSMKLLAPANDRVGIVTNGFHLYRSLGIARKAGIRHACGIAAGSSLFYLPNNLMRESLCLVKDLASGNL